MPAVSTHDVAARTRVAAASLAPRWLRRAVCVLATAALPLAAQAAAGELVTTVTRLQPQVTYSDPTLAVPLATYVGYRVSITNAGGNTINAVRFHGATSVTEAAERAVFSSIEGTTACTVGTQGTSIDCNFGQLKAGVSIGSFTVFFATPAKAVGSTLPDGVDGSCDTTDCVAFEGFTMYAEGTGGLNSPPDNSIAEWGPVYVPLGTDNPLLIESAVPKAGGTFFTGKSAVTTDQDRFATLIVVPSGASFTTATIEEQPTPGCNAPGACWTSALTIPGTFSPYLRIVFRLDAAAIPKGAKIGSMLVTYDGAPVGDCADATTPLDNQPCIAKRTWYKSKVVPGWTADLDGDFEWVILNTKNGSYKFDF